MPTSTDVTNLKINQLTEAQYDTAVQGGVIGANELSILTDAEAGQVIQVATLPTASASEEGKIYQFTGTTDATYTNGYFYKCVSDGQQPATYSWTQVNVQPAGGSSLPSQTGNAGKFLTTDGTDASWSDTVIGAANVESSSNNKITKIYPGYVYMHYDKTLTSNTKQVGLSIQDIDKEDFGGSGSGYYANLVVSGNWGANVGAVLGRKNNALEAIFTKKIVSVFSAYPYSAILNLPTYAGTLVAADFTGASAGQVLTLDNNLKPTWANASGGGATSATATLAVADWSNNSQTVNVTGVTASNNVIVGAAPASQADYTSAGIYCTAQGAGTLTFTCTTTPSSAITVNVLII